MRLFFACVIYIALVVIGVSTLIYFNIPDMGIPTFGISSGLVGIASYLIADGYYLDE